MNPDIAVQVILKKGLKNVNLGMFSESDKKLILEKTAEVYLRLGRREELLEILEQIDVKKFRELVEDMAEHYLSMGDYKKAVHIYHILGEKEIAESISKNFLEKS